MKRTFVIFFICAFLSAWCFAQSSVRLKNGRTVKGDIERIDRDKITVVTYVGKGEVRLTFYKEDIENIDGFSFDDLRTGYQMLETLDHTNTDKTLEDSLNEAIKLVEEKRGLPFIFDIKSEVVSHQELREYLINKIESEYTDEEIENEKKLLAHLRVIEKEFDYKNMILNMFTQQIAGVYEPKEDKIYILEDAASFITPLLPNEVIIHELVHALQDDYFFLDAIEDDLRDFTLDRSLAVKAVIEGEATLVSYSITGDFIRKLSSSLPEIALDNLDYEKFIIETMLVLNKSFLRGKEDKALLELMVFPYVKGAMFLKYALDSGGWSRVDSIYKGLPLSTEQIIHPEKYFLKKDAPLVLEKRNFDFLLGAGFKEISQGSLGEFMLYLITSSFLDESYAKAISSGWGNDFYYFYERENEDMFVSESCWDSIGEAEEFYEGIQRVIRAKHKSIDWHRNSNFLWGQSTHNLIYIGKRNNKVLVIESEINDKSLVNKLVKRCGFSVIL